MFCLSLAKRGFIIEGQKVKKYNGEEWTKTNHDLDFVFKKDGINYGCEIKNTLGYIEKKELDTKLEMCAFLRLRPLFILRYSPKTYNKDIIDAGGYAMIFESQIYELSQEKLVGKIRRHIGLPVLCSKAIPDGIIDRFIGWHTKKL